MLSKDADRMANSVDPDQNAPEGAIITIYLSYSNELSFSNKRPLQPFMGKRWSNATLNGFMTLKFCIFAHIWSQDFVCSFC